MFNYISEVSLFSMCGEDLTITSVLADNVSVSGPLSSWFPDLLLASDLLERREDEFESSVIPCSHSLDLGVPNPPRDDLLGLLDLFKLAPDTCLWKARITWPMKGAAIMSVRDLVPDAEEALVTPLSVRFLLIASMLSVMSPISSSSFLDSGSSSIVSR